MIRRQGYGRKQEILTIPIANHDNNQHPSNENMRLQNLWEGIETMATLMQVE